MGQKIRKFCGCHIWELPHLTPPRHSVRVKTHRNLRGEAKGHLDVRRSYSTLSVLGCKIFEVTLYGEVHNYPYNTNSELCLNNFTLQNRSVLYNILYNAKMPESRVQDQNIPYL